GPSRDGGAAQQREPASRPVRLEGQTDERSLLARARADGTDLQPRRRAGRIPSRHLAAQRLSLDPGAQLLLCVEPLYAVVVSRHRFDGRKQPLGVAGLGRGGGDARGPGVAGAGIAAIMPSPTSAIFLRAAPLTFALLWSSGFIVAKYAAADADPFTFLAVRFG